MSKNFDQDLNVSFEERDEKLQYLATLLGGLKKELRACDSLEKYHEILLEIEKKSDTRRPVNFSRKEFDERTFQEYIAILEKYNYPQEFIAWTKISQGYYIWCEAFRFVSLEQVIREITGYFNMATENGYLMFAMGASGDCFVYDMNEDNHPIKYFKLFTDSPADLYENYLEVEFNSDYTEMLDDYKEEYDPKEVYLEDGSFNVKSKYIRELYSEAMSPKGCNTLLDFVKKYTEEGFEEILTRYVSNSSEVFQIYEKA